MELIIRKCNGNIETESVMHCFMKRFQQMIDEYHSGSRNIEELFDELIKFVQGAPMSRFAA